jgi:membrane associated rhomboid family serine protease
MLVGIVLGTLVSIVEPGVYDVAFRPDQPLSGAGLPAILSVFLHAGFLHAFGNCVYLLLFGADVEHELGSRRFIVLLCAAQLLGLAVDGVLVGGHRPRVGASAALSGTLVAYVLLFPWREIEVPTSWVFPLALRGQYWVTLQVPWLLALWLAHQFLGHYLDAEGIAYAAHLGGAAAGVPLALRWRSRTA